MPTAEPRGSLTRRIFLLSSAALGILPGCDSPAPATTPGPDSSRVGETSPIRPVAPVMTALHVHASFSEGIASMEAQLAEAERLGAQVVWWTEHDWRMAGLGYVDLVPVAAGGRDGFTWTLEDRSPSDAGAHAFDVDDASQELTPDGSSALHITAEASSSSSSEHALSIQADKRLFSTSLQGQVWSLWVRPEHLERGTIELRLRTSWRPAMRSRDAGHYHLCYQFGKAAGAPSQVVDRVARIPVTSPPGKWTRVRLRPEDDLESAWPDIDGRDASCTGIGVVAQARPEGRISGSLGAVSIHRDGLVDGEPLKTQNELMTRYTAIYPTVRQLQGVEVSSGSTHLCWYGGSPRLNSGGRPATSGTVDKIHASGGVASFAHPFGVEGAEPDPAAQRTLLAKAAESLLPQRMLGCDALEVGYRQRGGATLSTHEALWDHCSRSGLFLTGVGVNDDHSGMDWSKGPNNFVSWIWSPSLQEDYLVGALRAGHVYFGDPTLFAGQLDLRTSAGGHMGSVVPSAGPTTPVEVVAVGLDSDATLELLRRLVTPEAAPITVDDDSMTTTFDAGEFTDGRMLVPVPTTSDCFVRTRVRTAEGHVVALSNPLWLVSDPQAYSVPDSRLRRTAAVGTTS